MKRTSVWQATLWETSFTGRKALWRSRTKRIISPTGHGWGANRHRVRPPARRGNNWANFIDCVRSRKKEDLNAPIQEAHISCTLIHLANASYRLGRTLNFDPATEQVTGDE